MKALYCLATSLLVGGCASESRLDDVESKLKAIRLQVAELREEVAGLSDLEDSIRKLKNEVQTARGLGAG